MIDLPDALAYLPRPLPGVGAACPPYYRPCDHPGFVAIEVHVAPWSHHGPEVFKLRRCAICGARPDGTYSSPYPGQQTAPLIAKPMGNRYSHL